MHDGWYETSLGEVITLQRGYDLPTQDRIPGIVPIISSSGTTGTHIEAKVKGPGVITGRYGTIGEVFYIKEDFWPLNTTLYVRDFKGNDPLFISYLLRTIDFAAHSDKSSVPGVNRNDLHMEPVQVPPLEEQRAIAAVLGALDDKIELNRRMNATLEAMVRALFKSWFVGFDPVRAKMEGRTPYGMDAATAALFSNAFEDSSLGPIPAGWHVGTIGDIARNRRDSVLPSQVTYDTRYVGLEHMPRGSIALGESGQPEDVTSSKMRFDAWDILFGRLRPYFKKVGVPGFAGICSADIAVVQTKEPNCFGLLLCTLSDPAFIDYTDRVSNGAKMPRVGWSDMARYDVPIAPAPILGAFDSNVRDFVCLIHTNVEQLETLAAIRDALLPKLLSGAVRIRDAMRVAEMTSLVRRETVTHE